MDRKVIGFSKFAGALLLLMCAAFVLIGLWMLLGEGQATGKSSGFVTGLGLFAVLFFLACGFVICKTLLSNREALTVDSNGIVDNSSARPAGFIPWSAIEHIDQTRTGSQKFISIYTTGEAAQTENATVAAALIDSANVKLTGTAVNISSNMLQMDGDELFELLSQAFADYKRGVVDQPVA